MNVGEATDGGALTTKIVYTLTKDNYTVSYQIINDDVLKTEEMYNSSKERLIRNVKDHNEKYSDQYKWTYKVDDKAKRTISTRTYDMTNVRDNQGKTYDSQYKFYKEDGTYDIESWMNYKRENGNYTCSQD